MNESCYNLFDRVPDILLLLEPDGTIRNINQYSSRILNKTSKELIGHNILGLIQQDHQELFILNLNQITTGKEFSVEVPFLLSSEKFIPVEIRGSTVDVGKDTGIICIIRDISLQKSHEDKFIVAEQALKTVFDQASSAMFILNDQLQVTSINQAGIKEFNLAKSADSLPKKLGVVLNCTTTKKGESTCKENAPCYDCELYMKLYAFVNNERDVTKEEITLRLVSQGRITERSMLISIMRICQKDAILVTLDRVKQPKEIESEATMAKKKAEESDKLITTFMTNLSRELRTPLNGIMGFSELLMNASSLIDMRNFADIINKNSKRLLNIIEDMLIVSSLNSGTMRINRRDYLLSNVIDNIQLLLNGQYLAYEKRNAIELKYRLPNEEGNNVIQVDLNLLMIIIKNLFRNALTFTEKGFIEFGLQTKRTDELIFYIKDTGVGISEKQKNHIFKFFKQGDEIEGREHRGIGTGLSIAKSMADRLNGTIWFESKIAAGSVFYISLPISAKFTEIDKVDQKLNTISVQDKRFLIVEDIKENYYLLQLLLEEEGAKAFLAESGEKALQLLTSGEQYDLILMDLRMPKMDGYETTMKIREINPSIKIIAQSAMAAPEDIQKAYDAGCNDFIEKPIQKAALIDIILRNLRTEINE